MDEDVLVAGGRLDETVTLGRVNHLRCPSASPVSKFPDVK
jgi:hypothetical protein